MRQVALAAFTAAACLGACAREPAHDARRAPQPVEPTPVPAFALPSPLPARYLRTLAYDPGGYDGASPPGGPSRGPVSDLLLGDLLYHSPSTLGPRAAALGISCQTCHPNGAAGTTFYLDGLSDRAGNVDLSTAFFRAEADDGRVDPVNIPSLRGARYTGPYGLDGRTASLADFIQGVVTSEFQGDALRPRQLAALVRYVQDLDFLPDQNLDARSHLSERAGGAARRGEAIFTRGQPGFDGKSCATCHDPSTFFRDGRVHRLGTETSPSPTAMDGGYETPTLLGTMETAPYFHDGRFATLREVVGWFDASYRLGLSAAERDDLTAYVEAVGAVDRTHDDRPLARRKNEAFAYVALVDGSQDRLVTRAAVAAVLLELEGEPAVLSPRVRTLRTRLLHVRDAITASDSGEDVGAKARALRSDLARLAADWAGVLSVEK